eukprot:TRINITY_DN5275_c0_g1_i1.p1 TRINITY_DN5275_c0_g1~~TRINITY_DN5275_c0_g1_i1.p1  ORF type:complete len:327 (+),score=75.87 TRINITY_DN5275_c0_g1_i1:21-1001(+)
MLSFPLFCSLAIVVAALLWRYDLHQFTFVNHTDSKILNPEWTYQQVWCKAAHNSIDRWETIEEQLDPTEGNCGAIELDIVIDPTSIGLANSTKRWRFGVQHHDDYHPQSASLQQTLRSLANWSHTHPQHEVVTVHLDLKRGSTLGDHSSFADELDRTILDAMGRDRIFFPRLLQRNATSLVNGIKQHGWPSLRQLRQKFIFVLSGHDWDFKVHQRRMTYLNLKSRDRVCFVDIDQRHAPSDDLNHPYFQVGDRIFINLQLGFRNWDKLGIQVEKSGIFITRVWRANGRADWMRCLQARIHLIATDRIRHYEWANLGSATYQKIESI